MDGGERQVAGQGTGGRAAVHPGQFQGHQAQGQVLGTGHEAAVLGVHVQGGEPGLVKGFEKLGLARGPLVGVALAVGHHAGHQAPGNGPGRLHGHLEVEALGVAPHDLPDIVAREGAEEFHEYVLKWIFRGASPLMPGDHMSRAVPKSRRPPESGTGPAGAAGVRLYTVLNSLTPRGAPARRDPGAFSHFFPAFQDHAGSTRCRLPGTHPAFQGHDQERET